MIKFKEQIKLIIEQIDKTSILLEQNKGSEAYASMSEIVQLLTPILPDIIQNENNEININQNKFILTLTQALETMKMKDNLLLADLLQYELKESLISIIK